MSRVRGGKGARNRGRKKGGLGGRDAISERGLGRGRGAGWGREGGVVKVGRGRGANSDGGLTRAQMGVMVMSVDGWLVVCCEVVTE